MTPEERDLIAGLFGRLRTADTANKDRDADELIRRGVVDHPAAPYLLVQTALVQEHALNGAQARIAELEKQVADTKAPASSGATSFLGSLAQRFSPPPAQTAPRPSYRMPEYQPAAQPAVQPAAAARGGFLQHAVSTAAGVAGGALLFEGIQRLMGHAAGPFSGAGMMGGSSFGSPWGQPSENVTVNNYYRNDGEPSQSPGSGTNDGTNDGGYQDAQVQEADYDTTGDDTGGGGDMGGGDWT